jgi:DNA polymerase III delta prime subunit
MGFAEMKQRLQKTLEDNARLVRQRKESGELEGRLCIPVLSGPSGIGKTACVRALAEELGYSLIRLDCSFMPANHLVVYLNNLIQKIELGETKGAILLLEYFDEADEQWRGILMQYAENMLDTEMQVADPDGETQPVSSVRHRSHPVKASSLPEQIFIVGEQTTD